MNEAVQMPRIETEPLSCRQLGAEIKDNLRLSVPGDAQAESKANAKFNERMAAITPCRIRPDDRR
jgi:hypothetical protein